MTMDKTKPLVNSLLVIGEYFVCVGDEVETRDFIKTVGLVDYEIIDCHGNLVIPGFNDSHMHLLGYIESKCSVCLNSTNSILELIQKLKNGISQVNVNSWLVGQGWNQDLFEDEKS
jgi:predicted amidohydrolase YtcJ